MIKKKLKKKTKKKEDKMIIVINDRGQSFWFKQTQLVVYKFDTISNAI